VETNGFCESHRPTASFVIIHYDSPLRFLRLRFSISLLAQMPNIIIRNDTF